ncbi:MAG TPA: class 1 fructose-bisphosphatase [Candidatus Saccharimonadales bacterium]|nr:class 1 fructose-bisphosphatase [Candidatus Saccharimonadales bacterium]
MPDLPETLQQYLLDRLADHPERLQLVMMMADIATIGKLISAQLNRAGLAGVRGLAGSTNIQDEAQAKLDIYANDLCKQYLASTGLFAAMASEEEDEVVDLENPQADYVIAFDPLDGSGNIDVNVSVGTIFSVCRKLDGVPAGSEKQFLQPGRDQVLAGYLMYGSSTMLVFSWGDGVHEFTFDMDLGEFFLSNDHLQIPKKTMYYSVNASYEPHMSSADRKYTHMLRDRGFSQRWVGAFVADFHRNLLKGGVFFMPGTDKSGTGEYKPKLRLNYEVKPMALLAEQAGGAALIGHENALDFAPERLHQRVPVVIGDKHLVNLYKEET